MGAPVNKNPDFIFHQKTPPNGGPPLNRLIDEFATPVQDFFLRTHGDMPEFDSPTYRLTVGGMVKSPCQFSVQELAEHFRNKKNTATFQATVNRPSIPSAI